MNKESYRYKNAKRAGYAATLIAAISIPLIAAIDQKKPNSTQDFSQPTGNGVRARLETEKMCFLVSNSSIQYPPGIAEACNNSIDAFNEKLQTVLTKMESSNSDDLKRSSREFKELINIGGIGYRLDSEQELTAVLWGGWPDANSSGLKFVIPNHDKEADLATSIVKSTISSNAYINLKSMYGNGPDTMISLDKFVAEQMKELNKDERFVGALGSLDK